MRISLLSSPLSPVGLALVGVLIALLGGCAAVRIDPVPATPQRPTFSSDTSTTGEGTFETESGLAFSEAGDFDSPIALKWGAGPRTEINVGWSPFLNLAQDGPDASGVGDLQVGVRHRFLDARGAAPAAAFQFYSKLPTGDRGEGISSGEVDFFAAGIVSKAFGPAAATLYYRMGVLGNPDRPDTDLEHTLTISGSYAVDERWGAFGELASILTPERDLDVYVGILGTTYTVAPHLILDMGMAIGLSSDAPDFQVILGFTSNWGGLSQARLAPVF